MRDSKKRRCGFCGKMPLNGVNVLLIVLICVVIYVANHFEMKEYRAKMAQEQQKQMQQKFDKLTKECFFQNKQQACEILKSYEQ